MKSKLILLLLPFLFFAGQVTARSHQAIFAVPQALVGQPYKQNVPEVLRETYKRELVSGKGTIEWSTERRLPKGLVIDANGTILGIPQVAGTFTFGVNAVDTAYRENGATRLTLSLTVLRTGRSFGGSAGPVLAPVPPNPQAGNVAVPNSEIEVTVGDFPPRQLSEVPLTVRSPAGVRLEVLVFDKNETPQKRLHRPTSGR